MDRRVRRKSKRAFCPLPGSTFRKSAARFAFLLMTMWMGSSELLAQDPNFTQYYSSPLYLNPAFTGTIPFYRIATSYRRHLTGIPGAFSTNIASADMNLDDINSGIGIIFMNDRAGALNLQSNHILGNYAYQIQLNRTFVLRAGVQGGYIFQSTGLNGLTFGDQIASGNDNSMETLNDVTAGLPDISFGMLLYSDYLWVGASAYHMNQPSQLTEVGEINLPMRMTVHAGVKIPIDKLQREKVSISPSFLYQRQGQFDQLDLGANLFHDPLTVGLWYRGIPIQQTVGDNLSQDAISAMVGIQLKTIWVGYSYDYRISSTTLNPGASHEISLIYQPFKQTGKSRIRCPAFYGI